ncbi:MAG TPA: ArsI/CadI family heavy metal resistance metalloenzyme, partial [Pyrinomonadaceae bacterium]|nr:ArsI/CadI family heavy metal resistance metalloenzyme [Pyrinomonadaceae bacterium]
MTKMEKTETVRALKAHLAINVRDVEESLGFYKKLFGIEPSKVRKGYAKFNVENPPLNFTLNQGASGERGALSHLGIQVGSTEDVLAVRERWRAQGLVPRDEMQTNCCYALQDKAWVRDPDGNEWEVFVVIEDNLAQTSACCVTDADGRNVCATTGEVVTDPAAATSCCAPASPVTLSR